jgi:uncharacterized protein with PQ loop repeat
MVLGELVGWAATVLGTTLAIPQLLRLIRTRSVEGLSLIGWQALLTLNLAWTAHGIGIGQPAQILTNALALLTTVPILVLMARTIGRSTVAVLLPAIALGVAMIAFDLLLGSTAFGIAAILPSLVVSGGQTGELVRAETVRGVSPLFLVLGVVNLALWDAWAVLVNDPGTLISVTITLLVALLNLVWYVLRRIGLPAFFLREPAVVPMVTADID